MYIIHANGITFGFLISIISILFCVADIILRGVVIRFKTNIFRNYKVSSHKVVNVNGCIFCVCNFSFVAINVSLNFSFRDKKIQDVIKIKSSRVAI